MWHFLNITLKIFFEENRDKKDDFGKNRKRIDLFFCFLSSFEILDLKFYCPLAPTEDICASWFPIQ